MRAQIALTWFGCWNPRMSRESTWTWRPKANVLLDEKLLNALPETPPVTKDSRCSFCPIRAASRRPCFEPMGMDWATAK